MAIQSMAELNGFRCPANFDEKNLTTDWLEELSEDGNCIFNYEGHNCKIAFYRQGELWQITYNTRSNWLKLEPFNSRNGEDWLIKFIMQPEDNSQIEVEHISIENKHIFKFWFMVEKRAN